MTEEEIDEMLEESVRRLQELHPDFPANALEILLKLPLALKVPVLNTMRPGVALHDKELTTRMEQKLVDVCDPITRRLYAMLADPEVSVETRSATLKLIVQMLVTMMMSRALAVRFQDSNEFILAELKLGSENAGKALVTTVANGEPGDAIKDLLLTMKTSSMISELVKLNQQMFMDHLGKAQERILGDRYDRFLNGIDAPPVEAGVKAITSTMLDELGLARAVG